MLSAMSIFLLNAGKRHEKRACFHGRLLCKLVFPAVYVVIFFCGLYTSTSEAASILNLSRASRASGTTALLLLFIIQTPPSFFLVPLDNHSIAIRRASYAGKFFAVQTGFGKWRHAAVGRIGRGNQERGSADSAKFKICF